MIKNQKHINRTPMIVPTIALGRRSWRKRITVGVMGNITR